MLRNRWIVAAGGLASLVCAGLVVLAILPARPGITWTNFNRLESGMTQAEAEAILGGPPRAIAPNGTSWWMLLMS
jgi:hypothetical protein